MKTPLKWLVGVALLSCAAGCSWTDKRGTHHLIVGVGFAWVTTTNAPGVEVYDAHVYGASAGPDGAGVGVMTHHRVQIDPVAASNVVISVKSTPGGLRIQNYSVTVNTNQTPE